MKVTGPNGSNPINDEQIRELASSAVQDRRVRRLCKIALNDAPTYLRSDVVEDARRRCADLWNERKR